jgi:hypothetical protein
MSLARNVLDELAGIGAKIEPAGSRLILRAGNTAIPAALVRRVRDAKGDLIALLSQGAGLSLESRVVRWLNARPAPSPSGRCAWCHQPETPSGVVLPFGTEPGTHTWLHAQCWQPWQAARRSTAVAAISTRAGP